MPQRKRSKDIDRPPFRLTPRDRQMIQAVYEYRAITTQHLSDLFFVSANTLSTPKPSSRCLHRCKLLYQYGFLDREERPSLLSEGRLPLVYRLAEGGADALAVMQDISREGLGWRANENVGPIFINHMLASNDVRVAIVRAAERHGFVIEKWLDERTLKRFRKDTVTITSPTGRKQTAAVVPDGYFHLKTDTHHYHHAIEIDLASVTGQSKVPGRRTVARKVLATNEWFRSGLYFKRFNTRSLRVLWVSTGERRMGNLRSIAEKNGGRTRFWFTTFKRIEESDVLTDKIWEVASVTGLRSLVW